MRLAASLNEANLPIVESRVSAPLLAKLIARTRDGTISNKIAKDVFAAMWAGEGDADTIIAARGLREISDDGALTSVIDAVIAEFPPQAAEFRAGNEKLLQFFIGQSMKHLRGQGNPQRLNALLREKLNS